MTIDNDQKRAMLLSAVQYLTEREAIESTVDGEDYTAREAHSIADRTAWLRLRGELADTGEQATYTLVAHREASECWHGGSCYGNTPESVWRRTELTPLDLVSALADIEQDDKSKPCCAPKRTRHVFVDGRVDGDPQEHVTALLVGLSVAVSAEVARRVQAKLEREAADAARVEAERPARERAAKQAALADAEAAAAKLRAELKSPTR